MDYMKNKCPVCMKLFCCSAHRADHEVKNHSETYPKLKQDFLVHMFQKRARNILIKSQNRQASVIKENQDNYINEKLSNNSIPRIPKVPLKRLHREINRRILSSSVSVSETRKILLPVHRLHDNQRSREEPLIKPNCQSLPFKGSQKASPYASNIVKTSTPILVNLSKEKTATSNWDYVSPASTISYYETPNMAVGEKSEGRLLFRPQLSKTSITPLRSIMAKKYVGDSDTGVSPNLNSSKGRRVTFSFSSSRVSSTNSSPLESVQEIEIHEEIQDDNKEGITSVSTVKNFNERQITTGNPQDKNYVFEVTSMINSCVHTSELGEENITHMQRFTEDSVASVNGGLFSCMTNMFCSAVQTFPLWGFESRNKSKRSRSPEREVENVVVQSPVRKRPCYPRDLRLNPIRARKPISQPLS